ncbi:MAG: hypothetical protein ACHQCG_01425 [Solirubrobacterales bacterium]
MIDLEAVVVAAVRAAVEPLAVEVAGLRRQIEAQAEPSVYIDSATAAALGGWRSTAALRMAARRDPHIAAARVGRRWDRARLLAALEERGRR